MRVGVYFTAARKHGGVYQYSLAMLESLLTISNNHYIIFTISPDIPKRYYRNKNFTIIELSSTTRNLVEKIRNGISLVVALILPKFIAFLYKINLFWLIAIPDRYSQLTFVRTIESHNIDFMIYPTSSNLSFLAHVPSVVAIHDLAHKIYPEFPEVSAGGRWELREYSFQNQTKFASRILVDSVIGKEDVLTHYPNTDPNKIVILPFLPPSYLNLSMSKEQSKKIIKKFNLPSKYFFYPAKFWPHKHHIDLLKALKITHEMGYKYGLALTGTAAAEFDTYSAVKKKIKEYGLEKYVKLLGHVTDQEISALYKGAVALTMPTNFGPTNIPVLEAWALGVPVIYSNVRGCKEQLGNAGISISPVDSKGWAMSMIKMDEDKKFTSECIKAGKVRLNNWTMQNFTDTVSEMIQSLYGD